MCYKMCDCRPLGKPEIAELFGYQRRTAHQWHHRNELPPANWPAVNGSAAWDKTTILLWAARTGRVDRLGEADRAEVGRLLRDLETEAVTS